MEIDDRITVSTPEGVDLELVVAGVGSRFMSSLVDSALQALLIIPLLILGGAGGSAGVAVASLLGFLVVFGYPTVCDALLDGRTVGRRLAGLRLVTTEGDRVGFLAAAVRNILRLVDFMPGMYAIGALTALATARSQRLGDLAAGTLVVRGAPVRTGPVVPGAGRRQTYVREQPSDQGGSLPDGASAWDLTRVSVDDVRVVRSFLARRPELEAAARQRVASELARRIRPAVVGPAPDLPDEVLLEQVLAVKTTRS